MEDEIEDNEFDNKVYSALSKKLLPSIELNEQKDLGFYVGTIVLVYLVLIGIACLVNSYTQKQYNKSLVEFRQ